MIAVLEQALATAAVCGSTAMVGFGMLLSIWMSVRWWRKRFREPFHEGILRPAGWGCLERRQDGLFDFATILGALPVLWGGLAYVVINESMPIRVGTALAAVPITVLGLARMKRAFLDARLAKLGFLGECAVAEALAPLTRKGWEVFHDLPMESNGRKFNIDHVVVGPAGVWAIETKAYSKSRIRNGRRTSLHVQGESILMPDGRRRSPVRQAKRQAARLQERLSGLGAEIDFVEPLVVLPGWQVSYATNASRRVRDSRNVVAFLEGREACLSSAEQQRIIGMLDKECRVLHFDEPSKRCGSRVNGVPCDGLPAS